MTSARASTPTCRSLQADEELKEAADAQAKAAAEAAAAAKAKASKGKKKKKKAAAAKGAEGAKDEL